MIPNALQPAEVDEVILCQEIGRAIVLVREDQLSLAIGKRGQNVRLASKLCGWDIEIMTQEELEQQIDRAVKGFSELDGVTEDLANMLVGEGYLSYDDLSVIEPDFLMGLGSISEEEVDKIVVQAEARAEEAERIAEEQAELRKQQAALEKQQSEASASNAPANAAPAAAEPSGDTTAPKEESATAESETEPAEKVESDSDGADVATS